MVKKYRAKNKGAIDFEHCSGILKALAHPLRLRMVSGLSQDECNVNKMVDKLGIPQSTVSQHLAVLKNKGIVTLRKEGVLCCYRVEDEMVKKLLDAMSG